ncbi:protein kinase, putative [Bodo saltans]|uniref:Protein kinase, putative n=1 Tax=Bodo saltans TaxID=75058 RepID=A0A0S4JTP3_BODSA|nr:protein kinase, putative [Bodo saltans]|eukprot:CUG93659.1 protein kinase, putative [Bodo saltans]
MSQNTTTPSLDTTARILQELKDLAQSMVASPLFGGVAALSTTTDSCEAAVSKPPHPTAAAGGVENATAHHSVKQSQVAKKHADPSFAAGSAVAPLDSLGNDVDHIIDRILLTTQQPTTRAPPTTAAASLPQQKHKESTNTTGATKEIAAATTSTLHYDDSTTAQSPNVPLQRQTTAQHRNNTSQNTSLNASALTSGGGGDQTPPVDMDGSTFDGVKTLVLFLNSDPERFEQLTRSIWAPEHVEVPVSEDASEEDLAMWVRLPSFPFGGGVTDAQERYLFHKYCETRLGSKGNSPQNRHRGGGGHHHHRSPKDTPARITLDAFRTQSYREALVGSELRGWRPDSVSDFVVEVEPDVVFDAHTAKAARRLKLAEAMNHSEHGMAAVIQLRVIMDPLKTGFEEDKEYNIQPGQVVANRFQIVDLLGTATFSRAVRAYDLHQPIVDDSGAHVGFLEVCLKIINNSKEFFDQSLDEIRLLQLINSKADPDDAHVVRLIDFFYYKEHTFLVTELLSDNLYEYAKFNREHESEYYFTLARLRSLARQILTALAYIHSLNLMHCDLKPENILFVSHRRCIVKVIDFGSSCFLSDHLSSYIQSRSYRAPEVILGADYDGRIDVWSVGAILAELVTGDVLFSSETVPEMLARIVAICGKPLPRAMLWEGRHTQDFVTKFGCIYETGNKERDENAEDSYYLYTPMPLEVSEDGSQLPDAQLPYAMLRAKLAASGMTDPMFVDFIQQCLTLDHHVRPTAQELLGHPFLFEYNDDNAQGGNSGSGDSAASSLDDDVTDIEPEYEEDDEEEEDGGTGDDADQ